MTAAPVDDACHPLRPLVPCTFMQANPPFPPTSPDGVARLLDPSQPPSKVTRVTGSTLLVSVRFHNYFFLYARLMAVYRNAYKLDMEHDRQRVNIVRFPLPPPPPPPPLPRAVGLTLRLRAWTVDR